VRVPAGILAKLLVFLPRLKIEISCRLQSSTLGVLVFELVVAFLAGTWAIGFVDLSARVPAERSATLRAAVTIAFVVESDLPGAIHARFYNQHHRSPEQRTGRVEIDQR
jgi:hypothetical protein